MRITDCRSVELPCTLSGKIIVPYGVGAWLMALECETFAPYKDQMPYILDEKGVGQCELFGSIRPIKAPEALVEEKRNTVVILTSPVYQLEMYNRLCKMELPDNIEVISLPFLSIERVGEIDAEIIKRMKMNDKPRIPKTIHCFWFSGEEKPESYKRCITSWSEKCGDYKIIEWNQKNYDCGKHPFVKRAIELKMWAFATDYARLDVISQYGGWYLDMDVEIIKPFDDLLGNKAVFGYANRFYVDTAVFAAERDNSIVNQIRELYDGIGLPCRREEYKQFFAPMFQKNVFKQNGVKFDGRGQILEDMTVVTSDFFFPLESVMFERMNKTENTYAIHYDNFGWGLEKKSTRDIKLENNRELWRLFSLEKRQEK